MIRTTYINRLVLNIYSQLEIISFPLDMNAVIDCFPNCKYMSYQKFAEIAGCSISDVIQICESKSGCTHYDFSQKRYLILCNQSTDDNNNAGRQRWTCGHEIGHVACGHHIVSAFDKLSENSLLKVTNPQFEAEADYFAATLLAPFPIIRLLDLRSADEIKNVFGLSFEAAVYRYDEYIAWRRTHRKTAWENDMVRLYLQKNI